MIPATRMAEVGGSQFKSLPRPQCKFGITKAEIEKLKNGTWDVV